MQLRINEAIERAKRLGLKVNKQIIAEELWKDISKQARQVRMTNLCSGRTDRHKPENILTICKMCNCTPNYLYGYEENN